MNDSRHLMWVVALLSSVACTPSRNATDSATPAARGPETSPPVRRGAATASAVVDARVDAIRRHDRAAYDSALHPACRATITSENRFFFDEQAAREVAFDIKDEVATQIKEVPAAPEAAEFTFAVKPTALAHVSFIDPSPPRTIMLTWQLVEDDTGWYVVMPTPTAAGLEILLEKQRLREEARAAAARRVAEMDPRVRAELEKYLSTQRTNAAARVYRRHAGVTMPEARMVIEMIYDAMEPDQIDQDPYD